MIRKKLFERPGMAIYFTCEKEKIVSQKFVFQSGNTTTSAPQIASGRLRSERKDLIRLCRYGITTIV